MASNHIFLLFDLISPLTAFVFLPFIYLFELTSVRC
nr:MAG TPA: hypothetical protein [Caudoviricetes sp.]